MIVLVTLSACEAASPARLKRSESVIVVVANRLLFSDLNDPQLPAVQKMLRMGAIGLISPNCAGPKTEASVILTANAGSPSRGGSYIRDLYHTSESLPNGENAADAYFARTGRRAPQDAAVFLGLAPALRDAFKQNYLPGSLGCIGDSLQRAGIRTLAAGNADTQRGADRSAAALVMNSAGIVDDGKLIAEPTADAVIDSFRVNGDGRYVGVIHFGLPAQLDDCKLAMTDAAFARHKSNCMRDLDDLLDELISKAKNTTIVLVSFSPPNSPNWDQMTPVVIYPSAKPGLLITSATRSTGIVAASDFAPSLLKILDVSSEKEMLGRAAEVVSSSRGAEKLTDIGLRVATNHRLLLPLGVGLAVICAISFTSAACVIAFSVKPSQRIKKAILNALVVAACAPAALYLAPLAPIGYATYLLGAVGFLIILSALSMAIGKALQRRYDTTKAHALPVAAAYAITALIIIIDSATGGTLGKFNGISSYYISAMRFHGIGNEYAGALISTAALTALYFKKSRWMAALIGIITIVTLGMGFLGSNYGGVIVAVIVFALVWVALQRGRYGGWQVAAEYGAGFGAVALFAILDWALAGRAGSHAAQATGLAGRLGGSYIWSLAIRKMIFNLRLTFSVKGISVLCAFVPFLTLWFWGVKGKLSASLVKNPQMLAGTKAILAGAVAAFLFNDSGIVFAITMIAMTVLMLLYFLIEEVADVTNSSP